MEQLTIGHIDIDVKYKDIKNIHLSVHPPLGNVTISAPKHLDPDIVRVFAIGKLGWIRKERSKFINQPREQVKEFTTQESHYFLGKRYLLRVTESGSKSKVVLHHSHIELIVPIAATVEKKRQVLYQWYRKELRALLTRMISDWKKKMAVKVSSFGIRKMKTKWGSCNSAAGTIWFNIELAKRSKDEIEYVVVHELVHLLERNHNKKFVLLMNHFLPDWRIRKQILNKGEII